jgi:hypothetical protein
VRHAEERRDVLELAFGTNNIHQEARSR